MLLSRIVFRPLNMCRNAYRRIFRFVLATYNRLRLRNKDFSVISRDCVGGVLLHELGVRFDSPTVNLYLTSEDFVKFCKYLKFYLSEELIEDTASGEEFPVGVLGSGERMIRVYFLHYDSFKQAKEKWLERVSRMHWDNLFFIMNGVAGCKESLIREFDAIPCEHKAFLTYRDIDGINSAVKIKDRGIYAAGTVLNYISKYSARKIIDDWDYVSFFNSQG